MALSRSATSRHPVIFLLPCPTLLPAHYNTNTHARTHQALWPVLYKMVSYPPLQLTLLPLQLWSALQVWGASSLYFGFLCLLWWFFIRFATGHSTLLVKGSWCFATTLHQWTFPLMYWRMGWGGFLQLLPDSSLLQSLSIPQCRWEPWAALLPVLAHVCDHSPSAVLRHPLESDLPEVSLSF